MRRESIKKTKETNGKNCNRSYMSQVKKDHSHSPDGKEAEASMFQPLNSDINGLGTEEAFSMQPPNPNFFKSNLFRKLSNQAFRNKN